MLLAIDTSTDDSGIALYDGVRVLAECAWHSGRRHAEQVLPLIDHLMQRLDLRPADLTAVAVATGPGSWSGLRVGMSLAKAIAESRGLPIIGVPTLDVLAYPHRHGALPVVPMVRLGRDRYGAAVYRRQEGWQRLPAEAGPPALRENRAERRRSTQGEAWKRALLEPREDAQ